MTIRSSSAHQHTGRGRGFHQLDAPRRPSSHIALLSVAFNSRHKADWGASPVRLALLLWAPRATLTGAAIPLRVAESSLWVDGVNGQTSDRALGLDQDDLLLLHYPSHAHGITLNRSAAGCFQASTYLPCCPTCLRRRHPGRQRHVPSNRLFRRQFTHTRPDWPRLGPAY